MDIKISFDKDTLDVLKQLTSAIEREVIALENEQKYSDLPTVTVVHSPFTAGLPGGSNVAPPVVQPPKYKSASAARVTSLLANDPLLTTMGATSKGCDLVNLASPEVSRYYTKSWTRDPSKGKPNDPITEGLLRVLKSRQRELGVDFTVPTGTLNLQTADALIESLKRVGRTLLRV